MASSSQPASVDAQTSILDTPTTPTPPSITPVVAPDLPASPNPWDDPKPDVVPVKPLTIVDPVLLEEPGFTGPKDPTPEPKTAVSNELLSEFDPLSAPEEQAAREAWAASEGHPPQLPPPRTPSPKLPPLQDLVISSPPTSPNPISPDERMPVASATAITSPGSFPSFGAFARAFALPLAKSRPQSLDGSAKALATPSSSTMFAAQQDGARDVTGNAPARTAPSEPSEALNSGATSPAQRLPEGGFDFQTFLDQMKSRSAEPVSKYLKS